MIHSLTIQGYQSVRKRTDLVLGRFTVITGPTGSGKTSLIRALRLLAFNAKGTGYISRGSKEAVVCLGIPVPGDRPYCAVAIKRGSRGADKYWITTAAEAGEPEIGPEFTKLGGKVPDQISALLKLTELNFAGQFDRPFLLDDSGSEVARVLGRLTNVTLLFEAAREGSRRKGEVVRELKRAEAEIERLTAEAQRFTRLRFQIENVQEAEEDLEQAAQTEARAGRLLVLTAALRNAQAHSAAIVLPEPPDTARLEQLAVQRERLAALVGGLKRADEVGGSASFEAEKSGVQAQQAEADVTRILREAGVCPTCGQRVGGEHGAHADQMV